MAGRIKGITVEIGGDTTGLEKALKNVNSTIKNTQSQLKDVNRLLKLDPGNTELITQKQRALKDAIGATSEKLETLKQAQEQAKQQLENGDLGQDKYDALQREIIETEQELRRLQEEAASTSVALSKIDQAGKKMEAFGDSVTHAGQAIMPASMAVAGLGAAAVKTAADFDEGMSKVAAISGATGDDLDALRDKAREIGAIIPMSQALEEGIDWIEEYNGVADQMASVMQDNLAGQLTILKSQIQELAISFGEMLMPAIRAIVSRIQAFVDKLNGMSESQRKAILTIGLIIAAHGPLLVIIGTVISKVGAAMQGFVKLATGIRKFGVAVIAGTGIFGKLGAALGGISAPVLAVIAVIAVLAAAFKHLWDTNEEFRNSITAIWEGIVNKISAFCQGIVDRLNALGFDFGSIIDVLKSLWDGLCQFLAPVFEAAFNVVSIVLGTVLDVITGLLDVFIGLFMGNWSQLWDGVKEIFSGVWEGITGLFENFLGMIKSLADTVLGWFGTTWEDVWTSVKSFFENIWGGITTFFSAVWSGIVSTVTGAVNTVKTVVSTVFNAIKSTASTIWSAIKYEA